MRYNKVNESQKVKDSQERKKCLCVELLKYGTDRGEYSGMKYRSLVSEIESYLKSLLRSSPDGRIEVRRKEIAELFDCVPSQITYVINTRFSVGHGYFVESRRGGGGYIRISNLFEAPEKAPTHPPVAEDTAKDARKALYALARRGVFNRREFLILSTTLRILESELSSNEGGKLFLQVLRELAAEGFF